MIDELNKDMARRGLSLDGIDSRDVSVDLHLDFTRLFRANLEIYDLPVFPYEVDLIAAAGVQAVDFAVWPVIW